MFRGSPGCVSFRRWVRGPPRLADQTDRRRCEISEVRLRRLEVLDLQADVAGEEQLTLQSDGGSFSGYSGRDRHRRVAPVVLAVAAIATSAPTTSAVSESRPVHDTLRRWRLADSPTEDHTPIRNDPSEKP